MRNRNRFENALFIQAGACNGRAVAKTLADAYEEAYRDAANGGGTDAVNADPAVQLMLHQLCHLARMTVDDGWRVPDNPASFSYERATAVCIERSDAAAIECLNLTRQKAPPGV